MTTLSPFRQEFLRRAEARKDDDRRVFEREHKHRKDKEDRERKADRDEERADMLVAILAIDADIEQFELTLDNYDAATVQGLQENEQELADVREELDRLLEQAYVLPDGRRVFKTEDGLRVFDENGVEVVDFDPDEIERWRPSAESFLAIDARSDALTEERRELLEYQSDLDKARDRLDDKGLTKGDLEEMKKRLEENRPDRVKHILGDGIDPIPSALGEAEVEFDPASLTPLLKKPTPSPS